MIEPKIVKDLLAAYKKTREGRKAYLRRRRLLFAVIGLLVISALILLPLYYYSDVIMGPPAGVHSVSGPGEWAMYAHDPAHTSNAGSPNLPSVTMKVIFTAGGAINSSAVVANGVVYFGSTDSQLYALDAATGDKLWNFKTGGWIESAPAVHNGIVYFGSNDGKLYALDSKTGKEQWEFKTRYAIKSTPAIADGKVVFGSTDYRVYALNEKNGKKIWSFSSQNWLLSSPVIFNGMVCIGSMDGFLYTLNINDGRIRLKYDTRSSISNSAVATGSTFYFVDYNKLYAIDAHSRNWPKENDLVPYWRTAYIYGWAPKPPGASGFLWMLPFKDPMKGSPVLTDNNIIINTGDKLIAIDRSQQKPTWVFQIPGAQLTSPSLANGIAYTGSTDGYVYALDVSTGEKRWDVNIGEKLTSTPVIADGRIYMGTPSGRLYMIE